MPGGKTLKSYRIYLLGLGGRLQLGRSFEARDDAAAVGLALNQGIKGQMAELWEGGRLVGRFSQLGVFTPA